MAPCFARLFDDLFNEIAFAAGLSVDDGTLRMRFAVSSMVEVETLDPLVWGGRSTGLKGAGLSRLVNHGSRASAHGWHPVERCPTHSRAASRGQWSAAAIVLGTCGGVVALNPSFSPRRGGAQAAGRELASPVEGDLSDLCWSSRGVRRTLRALKGAGQAQATFFHADSPREAVAGLLDRSPQLAWAQRVLFVLRGPKTPNPKVQAAWHAVRERAPEGRAARVFACGLMDTQLTATLITGALAGRRVAESAAVWDPAPESLRSGWSLN